MLIGLAACLLYFGCVGFYSAKPRRASLGIINESPQSRLLLRLCMSAILLLTLYIHSYALGLERGVAVWLGLLTVVGALSLWVSALLPKYHVLTGLLALFVALILVVQV